MKQQLLSRLAKHLDGLIFAQRRLKNWALKWKTWILPIVLVLYAIGIFYCLSLLELDKDNISFGSLLIVTLVLSPLSTLLNGLELKFCADAIQKPLRYPQALQASTASTLANILPLPAGFALRASILVSRGARVGEASFILLTAALLWLSLAAAITGFTLLEGAYGQVVGFIGAAVALILVVRIARANSISLALAFLAVRILMLFLLILQLSFCFEVIGYETSFTSSAVYVISSVIGTMVSIVPAGIGITEGVGAMLANLAGDPPSAAFISLALNRMVGLCVAGVVFSLSLFFITKPLSNERA